MSLFPKVTEPCPYKGDVTDILVGDICSLCDKRVHDLTELNEAEKRALISDCGSELCVSYKFSARPTLAAIAMGAAAIGTPAYAQDTDNHTAAPAEDVEASDELIWIIVGGLPGKDRVEWTEIAQNGDEIPEFSAPELPVVYEDDSPVDGSKVSQDVPENTGVADGAEPDDSQISQTDEV